MLVHLLDLVDKHQVVLTFTAETGETKAVRDERCPFHSPDVKSGNPSALNDIPEMYISGTHTRTSKCVPAVLKYSP